MSLPHSAGGMSRTRSGLGAGRDQSEDPAATPNQQGREYPDSDEEDPDVPDITRPVPNLAAPIDPATFQQQMFAMMNLLTQSIAGQHRQSASPAPVKAQEPKVKDPETFHGQRDSLNAFILECELIFELQPSRFGDDRTRVSYMISLLRGTPLLAVRPLMSYDPRPIMLDSHRLFVEYLQTNYGDPDEKGTARRKLKNLRQNGPASTYFAELQQYIAILGWKDQDPIIDRAIDGLKPYLKDEVARAGHRPETLADLVSFIVPLDNRLYEREQERKYEAKAVVAKPATRPTTEPSSIISTTFTPRSANVNQTSSAPATQQRFNGPRGPISDEEKQRRRDHNLCLRCAKPGHIAVDCTTGRPQPSVSVEVKSEPRSTPVPGNGQGSTN